MGKASKNDYKDEYTEKIGNDIITYTDGKTESEIHIENGYAHVHHGTEGCRYGNASWPEHDSDLTDEEKEIIKETYDRNKGSYDD